jgi:hypothetical protein
MKWLRDYLSTHPDATIRYRASDMVMNIHSDASYLSERGARSRAAGYFFLGWAPVDGQPIRLNGAILVVSAILRCVAASAAEAELGALFLNMKEARVIRLTLEELGHPQPPSPIHVDNSTAVGIVNGTIKRQRSRAMEMRYFWACDQVDAGHFLVVWHPGLENLADYFSKHHEARHHKHVRPFYLHNTDSPVELPRAGAPKILQEQIQTGGRVLGQKRGAKTTPKSKIKGRKEPLAPQKMYTKSVQADRTLQLVARVFAPG